MRHIFLITFLFWTTGARATQTDQANASHGTINIFLANGNGLVALTDSRLSSDGRPAGKDQKLFQINDHTVCAVAGFYMDSGAPMVLRDGSTAYPAYTSIADFLRGYFKGHSTYSISDLGSTLSETLDFVANINKAYDRHIDPSESKITIAGYRAGRLYIDQIELLPSIVGGVVRYSANVLPEKSVEGRFVYATAGIDRIARENLSHPAEAQSTDEFDGRPLPSPDQLIAKLAAALKLDAGASLTTADMLRIAEDLEAKTSNRYPNAVGDDVEVAVLAGGRVERFDEPVSPRIIPQKLPYLRITQLTSDGGGLHELRLLAEQAEQASFFILEDSSLSSEIVPLDRGLFVRNSFDRCVFTYLGTGEVFIDTSNKITNSELRLGPGVRIDDSVVSRLTSSYPDLRLVSRPDNPGYYIQSRP